MCTGVNHVAEECVSVRCLVMCRPQTLAICFLVAFLPAGGADSGSACRSTPLGAPCVFLAIPFAGVVCWVCVWFFPWVLVVPVVSRADAMIAVIMLKSMAGPAMWASRACVCRFSKPSLGLFRPFGSCSQMLCNRVVMPLDACVLRGSLSSLS